MTAKNNQRFNSVALGPYRYTYQDWIDSKIITRQLKDLYYDELISEEDYEKILKEQKEAYIDKVIVNLNSLCYMFYGIYKNAIAKSYLLNEEILNIQNQLLRFKSNSPDLYFMAIMDNYENYRLTSEQVADFKKQYKVKRIIISSSTSEILSPLDGIAKMKYLEWLLRIQNGGAYNKFIVENDAFRERLLNEGIEPETESIQQPKRDAKKGLYKDISYTWTQLFRDSEQADKVLGLLSEHLSDTGQWLTEPKGRHLVALCTELESKGYLINSGAISNPLKAEAFNRQFDTTLSEKNFQANKRVEAEVYREVFSNILPPYKPTPKV